MSMTAQTRRVPTSEPVLVPVKKTPRTGRVLGACGIGLALGLAGLGLVMRSNAAFAEQNVSRQLSQQRILFKPADALTAEERSTPCLVRYAGRPLTTGAQAACYADHFIGRHLQSVAGGRTYAEMREVQNGLRAKIAQAEATQDPAVPDLQRQLNEANGKRQALLEGESVRGLLLTSYGFATLGEKAGQAATVGLTGGAALFVLSIALLAVGLIRRGGR